MRFTIPLGEIEFRASRAGGPGGQHVNKAATRIEARWNVHASPALSDDQRARLLERLAHRLDKDGTIRVVSGRRRSQLQNREAAIARLNSLVRVALTPQKRRKPTKPSRAARERRLAEKRQRSERKRERQRPERE